MIRGLLLVLMCFALLGTSCPGPGEFCSNAVDGSADYGFTLTIPSGFECTSVFSNDLVLAQGRWSESATGVAVSIQVKQSSSAEPEDIDGVTIEDLADLVTTNGLTFERKKVTISALSATSYVGATDLASGNTLWVTVGGGSDAEAMLDTLNTILESVQTGG